MSAQYPSLKAVLHTVVKNAPVPADTVASMLGKNYFTMMSELSKHDAHKLDADLVLPIMRVTDSVEPLRFLAQQMGGVFMPMPEAVGTSSVSRHCMVALEAFGKLMRELGDALEDGVLTDAESDSVCKAGYDLQERVAALMTAVQRNVTVRGGN